MEGIGKLIELLNEYCEPMGYYYNDDDLQGQTKARVLSKEYGFIKWLVDNDKIDREKIDGLKMIPTLTYQNMIDDCDCGKSHWHPYTFVGYVDELLMLLAIQDEPIEFLCSILK